MTLKDIHILPPGWLIHIPDPGMIPSRGTDEVKRWIIGTPTKKEFFGCLILATNYGGSYFRGDTVYPILSSDKFTIIPPQDLIKYINYITETGAQYLKELKL